MLERAVARATGSAAVVLETERLVLRHFTTEDVEPLLDVLGDPVAMRYYPAPFDRAGVEGWVRRSQQRYLDWGYGLWAMVDRATGELVGDCGLTRQRAFEGREELEIGYHVRRVSQGRGYASEAARACLAWAFANTDHDLVISLMGESNLPSRRVAEKVHARFLGPCAPRVGIPHVHYGTTRAEFAADRPDPFADPDDADA